MGKNIVIYTAIFGEKDALQDPAIADPNCDYVCFTDNPEMRSAIWKTIICPQQDDPRKAAKVFKVLPHRYFPDHESSIWMDGNITISPFDVKQFLENSLGTADIAVWKHPSSLIPETDAFYRNCIYDEAEVCLQFALDNPSTILRQLDRYAEQQYGRNRGLCSTGVLMRKHQKNVAAAMECWWAEITDGSSRDLISFMYAVNTTGVNLAHPAGSLYDNPNFRVNSHRIKKQHNYDQKYATWLEMVRYLFKQTPQRLWIVYRSWWELLEKPIPFESLYQSGMSAGDARQYILAEVSRLSDPPPIFSSQPAGITSEHPGNTS